MIWRAGLLVALLMAVLFAPGAEAIKGPAVIDVTQVQIDHFGSGQSLAGAEDRWLYLLYNRRITKGAIGYSILNCTFIGKGGPLGKGVSDCAAIYSLARGKIVARGLIKQRGYYTLAVVGGTGFYSNVGGEVLAITIVPQPHEERLTFGLET